MPNRFIVTNVEHRTEPEQYQISVADPYMNGFRETIQRQHQSFELTLRPMDVDENTMFKLNNIARAGRTVSLQDTEYVDFMEPFKQQFIEFMMDKHPEKILSDPKAWDNLLGRN
ncbi:MAG: hypothetical protein DRH57_01535 [Candidatus Cloacimonadota bacterium]|nr:MAG: hypothetical protein DRH57_01535 [Candidatus Cloacimonadota bacterium]